MSARAVALLALALLALATVPRASARFNIEEGGLKVTFPPEAKKKFPNGFDMALANFGALALCQVALWALPLCRCQR